MKEHKQNCRSQWLGGLRRRSVAVGLLRLWVRIGCECCVLSGRGLCVVSVVCCQVEVCVL
jgi:hypothetical protein